jgi:cytochrome b subunit of formate dehydrogenase
MKNTKVVKKTVHWMFAFVTIIYVVTGLGILYYRIVESATFGLLTKALSYQIHTYLLIPFLVLLILHIYLALKNKKS